MEFKEEPQRWSISISGMRHELSLEQIFNLRNACDMVLDQRSRATESIVKLVCERLSMERHELFSTTRTDRCAVARFCVWCLLFKQGMSTSEIGKQFKKNHSTVSMGIRSLKRRLENSPVLQEQLSWLGGKLNNCIRNRHGNKL